MLNNLVYTIDDRSYERRNGFEYQLVSYEKGPKVGDLRSIDGTLFSVYKVVPGKKMTEKPAVCWVICNLPGTPEKALGNINKFFDGLHAQILNCVV